MPTYGRFSTLDPYEASASDEDPRTWTRHSYTIDDPGNQTDPSGLCTIWPRTSASFEASGSAPADLLAGQGYVLLGFGRDYNVDPRFIVALAGAETSFGKNITWGSNNAWNWGWNIRNPSNSPFISLAYGIETVTGGVRRLYLNNGLTTTSAFYGKYCTGPDCKNGLNNTNMFMKEQGGNIDDLSFPCQLP